jgi:hypothetical protein
MAASALPGPDGLLHYPGLPPLSEAASATRSGLQLELWLAHHAGGGSPALLPGQAVQGLVRVRAAAAASAAAAAATGRLRSLVVELCGQQATRYTTTVTYSFTSNVGGGVQMTTWRTQEVLNRGWQELLWPRPVLALEGRGVEACGGRSQGASAAATLPGGAPPGASGGAPAPLPPSNAAMVVLEPGVTYAYPFSLPLPNDPWLPPSTGSLPNGTEYRVQVTAAVPWAEDVSLGWTVELATLQVPPAQQQQRQLLYAPGVPPLPPGAQRPPPWARGTQGFGCAGDGSLVALQPGSPARVDYSQRISACCLFSFLCLNGGSARAVLQLPCGYYVACPAPQPLEVRWGLTLARGRGVVEDLLGVKLFLRKHKMQRNTPEKDQGADCSQLSAWWRTLRRDGGPQIEGGPWGVKTGAEAATPGLWERLVAPAVRHLPKGAPGAGGQGSGLPPPPSLCTLHTSVQLYVPSHTSPLAQVWYDLLLEPVLSDDLFFGPHVEFCLPVWVASPEAALAAALQAEGEAAATAAGGSSAAAAAAAQRAAGAAAALCRAAEAMEAHPPKPSGPGAGDPRILAALLAPTRLLRQQATQAGEAAARAAAAAGLPPPQLG